LFLYKNVFVIFKYEKERQNNDCKTINYLIKVFKFINSTTIMLFLTNKDPQVEVIGGSNLLMLVEGSLTRYTAADPERFCQELAEIGKTGIFHGKIKGHEEINEEEGI